ncbi:MAG: SufE family protein [Candidatus Marinimicrobia bacterium]|nr:SufE family protein [Candidatus Neomarinimicrobiota bacterium]MBT3501048.1 SufE family protein [Candidatus Neomarinimicrobiota bacterium]MBT3838808.1 SufE family protein [Candidatus Neomarinimicrobiota bacterium]MBT3998785.1 SufE family protein [Candidatus Neomarinimicrobiota bacterium]MBT4282655.1 SufE family protein [Candidatus Neomarinimicrobiota bacterium]
MTVRETLNEMNELFSIFDNPKDKFIQLMDMAKESKGLTESEKTDENKIYGCTSQAWVVADRSDQETFTFRTESDAMIVKGLLVLLENIFNQQPVNEILSVNSVDILNSIGLDGAVTSQRTNGFSSAVEKIQGLVK